MQHGAGHGGLLPFASAARRAQGGDEQARREAEAKLRRGKTGLTMPKDAVVDITDGDGVTLRADIDRVAPTLPPAEWASSRGLLPRSSNHVPFAVQGIISDEAATLVNDSILSTQLLEKNLGLDRSARFLGDTSARKGDEKTGVFAAEERGDAEAASFEPLPQQRLGIKRQVGFGADVQGKETPGDLKEEDPELDKQIKFLFLTFELRGLKPTEHYDNGTLVSFVLVETLNDRKNATWTFRGHSEPSTVGELHPRFTQTIKIPVMEHLLGTCMLTKLRFTVLQSRMRSSHHEQMSHDFANSPDCPVCAHFRELSEMQSAPRGSFTRMQSITDLLVKSDSITSPGAHKWMLRSNTSSRLVVPPKAQKVVGWENSQDSMRTGSVERTSSIERTSSNIERTSSTESFDRSPSITSPDTFVMRRSGPESPARAARGSTLGSPTKQNSPLKPGSPVKHSVPRGISVFQRAGSIVQVNARRLTSTLAAGSPGSKNMEFLIESTFSRNTQTLGVVEVEPSALISKTASADTDDVDAKKKECVRILKRLRAAQYTEDEEASMKTWAYKTWHKLGLRLLTEADLGHQKGDNIRLVFKNFDTGGAGTVDSQEFMQGLAKYKIRPTTKKSYQDLFELCDEGRYGEVHYEDFSRWVRGPQGCISIEAEIDLDKDRFFAKLWENYEGALQLKRSDNVVHRNKVMDARAEDGQKEKHYATSAKHKFSGPAATRGGVPYFWLSTSPGSTFLGFKPSHDRFSITNATPNKDQVDHPLAHLRALRATVHAVRTFQSQDGKAAGESPLRERGANMSPLRASQVSAHDDESPTSSVSALSPRRGYRGSEAGLATSSKSDRILSGGAQTHRGRLQDSSRTEINRSRGLRESYTPPFAAQNGSVSTEFDQAVDYLFGLTPLSFNTAAATVPDAGGLQLLCKKCAREVEQGERIRDRGCGRLRSAGSKEAHSISKLSDKEVTNYWKSTHPSAAVAPPTSVGRVLLTQEALRDSEAKKIESKKLASRGEQTAPLRQPFTQRCERCSDTSSAVRSMTKLVQQDTAGLWSGSGIVSSWDIAYGLAGRVVER